MVIRFGKVIVCFLLFILILIPFSSIKNYISEAEEITTTVTTDALNGGWLEERDGVKILHLNGSYYEMGYQHGFFLKDEIAENFRDRMTLFEDNGFDYEFFISVWNIMKNYLPQDYKDEMQGMADGAGKTFEEIAIFNTMPAVVNYMFGCSELAVWGDATSDGKLYHVRGLDGHNAADPQTGKTRAENVVLIVRRPEDAHASLYPEDAGAVCCWSGVNEKGIAIGEDTVLTNDTTFHGISAAFRMRMVLDYADTAEEAIDIMNSNRTCGWNFVISDGNVPIAYAVEQTANLTYISTWNDPVEAINPFWQIEGAVRRVNMFFDPDLAVLETGRLRYDPSGLQSILWLLQGQSFMFIPWRHYYALSKEIEHRYGTLDLNRTMSLFRDEYCGRTDFVMFLFNRILGVYRSIFQYVVCPETGDMVFSFAGKETNAFDNPVHYVNLFKLLQAEPP